MAQGRWEGVQSDSEVWGSRLHGPEVGTLPMDACAMRPTARENLEALYLMGVRMFAPVDDVDLYVLVLYYDASLDEDVNRPLTHNGRIVFFRDFELADQVLQLGDEQFRKYLKAPTELEIVYEPLKMLALVEHGD